MKYNIIVIASGGGHLTEAMIALENVSKLDILFITNPLPHLLESHDLNIKFIIDPHNSLINYAKNFIKSIFIYFKYFPSIIISTGAGISIALLIIGKLLGSKIIFIESGSRIQYPSRTGKLVYHFADYFVIQSEKLKIFYPKSILTNIL